MNIFTESCKKMSDKELEPHARVSRRYFCNCGICFCCACLDELNERIEKKKGGDPSEVYKE